MEIGIKSWQDKPPGNTHLWQLEKLQKLRFRESYVQNSGIKQNLFSAFAISLLAYQLISFLQGEGAF
jgi:hypothetical protein